ncbi:MAG: RNA-directed DNA polymerase [Bacteroidota bacterium]
MKCDIRKFFPSLSRAFMKSQFRRHIACEDTLWLMDLIVDSAPISQGASQDASKGLPIGNLTSQFWANLYMNPLDHFMKEELGVPGYIRYVDDFVLFHPSRVQLRLLLSEVETFVHKMKLNLHPNKTHIYQTHQGVPFLGFLIFPHYRWVQKARVHRFKRHLKKQLASQVDQKRLVQGVNSWLGHIRFGQSYQREMQTFAYLQQKGLNLFRRPSGSWGLVDQQ